MTFWRSYQPFWMMISVLQRWYKIFDMQGILGEIMCNFSGSTVPADGLAPLGARPSAGTVMTKSGPLHMWDQHCTLRWRHNGCDSISNHQPHDCLLNRLFRRRSKKTSKLCATGLSAGNSPVTGEFPAQRASNEENVSIWWRHHEGSQTLRLP